MGRKKVKQEFNDFAKEIEVGATWKLQTEDSEATKK